MTDTLEIAGVVVGLIYLWLEYRASAWLWVAGTVMPAIYLKVYYDAGLYADFAISIYYILASAYGLTCWLMGRAEDGNGLKITHMPRRIYAPLGAVGLLLFVAIGLALNCLTDSTVPWADGFTTALSILALWMLARKYLEQWLLWIAVDVACALLYIYKGLYPTSGLYLLYALFAFFGYKQWKKAVQ